MGSFTSKASVLFAKPMRITATVYMFLILCYFGTCFLDDQICRSDKIKPKSDQKISLRICPAKYFRLKFNYADTKQVWYIL